MTTPFARRLARSIESELKKAEEVYVDRKKDPARFFMLRPSSLPYCGLKRALTAADQLEAPRTENLATTYFTQVGHATHGAFQEMVGAGSRIVGDWKCRTCKTVIEFETYQECCGQPMQYHELEVKFKNTVVGHLDGLYRLEPKKGRKSPHVVWDYKTTMLKNVWKKPSPFPYKSNVAQIESYIPLLEAQYGIDVVGWALIYLARDNPFSGRKIVAVEATPQLKVRLMKKLERNVRIHRKMLVSETMEDLEVLAKYKLCTSLKDYKENVEDEYNPCPIHKQCFNPKALQGVMKKALKTKVFPIIAHAPAKLRKEMNL